MNEELKTNVDIRKNIKTLAEEYPYTSIEEIVNDFNVKELLTYTIDDKDVPRPTCYPFVGAYIEVIFDNPIPSCSAIDTESKVRQVLSNRINQVLSCTHSLEMSNFAKVIYHIDCAKINNQSV